MSQENNFVERRRHLRVKLGKAVVYQEGSYVGQFIVDNLSAGGALLIGNTAIKRDEPLEVSLILGDNLQVRLPCACVHAGFDMANAYRLGVSFQHETSETEDLIQNAVLAEIEKSAKPGVLVVDDCIEVCHALRRDLRALGYTCQVATNLSSTVECLENQDSNIKIALVDLFFGKLDGLAILDYLAKDHPSIHRILMSGVARSCQLDLAQLSNRAKAVLKKPWSRKRLAEVLLH